MSIKTVGIPEANLFGSLYSPAGAIAADDSHISAESDFDGNSAEIGGEQFTQYVQSICRGVAEWKVLHTNPETPSTNQGNLVN